MRVRMKRKILIASDCELSRNKMSNVLMSGGHKVNYANDAVALIQKLKDVTLDFDLLVLDINIPQTGGFSVLEWIRDCDRVGKPPVLVMGDDHNTRQTLKKLKDLGAAGFIIKGVTPEHFFFRVNKVLYGEKALPRMNARASINIPVNLTSVKRKNTGTLHNVSETGAFIHSYDNLKPEDKISLRFMLPEDNSGLSVDGKVVRIDDNVEKDSFFKGFGIHFTNTSPEVRTLIASVVNRAKEVDRIW